MRVLRRCWIVVFLCLACFGLGLAVPTGVSAGGNIFFKLSLLLGGLLFFSFLWARFSLSGVRVSRKPGSNRSQVGRFFEERLIVENTGPLPRLWLELRDGADLPGHQLSRVVNSLAPRQQRSWMVKTLCYRRGRFHLGPITLFSGDPFGLFLLQRKLDLVGSLVVYPQTFDLPGFSLALGQYAGGDILRRRTHQVTTNVAGVRDYVPGDNFGRIHWPSTARTNRLIVKEFELDPLADVWLFLDMDRHVHVGRLGDITPEMDVSPIFQVLRDRSSQIQLERSTEEYAVAVTASLARHFLGRGWSLGLVSYPQGRRRELVQADRGDRQLDRLLSILSVVHAEGQVALDQVLAAETVHIARNAVAVVVTPSTSPNWVAALRQLTTRGVRAFVIALDAFSFSQRQVPDHEIDRISSDLVASRVPNQVVRFGDALDTVLGQAHMQVPGR